MTTREQLDLWWRLLREREYRLVDEHGREVSGEETARLLAEVTPIKGHGVSDVARAAAELRAELIRVIDECLNAPVIKKRADLADAIVPVVASAVAQAVKDHRKHELEYGSDQYQEGLAEGKRQMAQAARKDGIEEVAKHVEKGMRGADGLAWARSIRGLA